MQGDKGRFGAIAMLIALTEPDKPEITGREEMISFRCLWVCGIFWIHIGRREIMMRINKMKKILCSLVVYGLLAFMLPMSVKAATEAESNNTFDSAQAISVNDTVMGNLATSGDTDYYMFRLSEPGAVSINLAREYKEGSRAQWVVEVYDGNFKKLVGYTFYENSTQSSVPPIGLPAGTFYIKVLPGYYHSNAAYKLTAKYTSSDAWETESNNSFPTANGIRLNSSVNGGLMHGSDADYYTFSLSTPGAVSLDFAREYKEGSRAQWVVEVYDGNFEKLAGYTFYENSIQSSVPPIGLPAGTFYIKVLPGYYYSDATYTLTTKYTSSDTWETERNDSFPTADGIYLNSSVNGGLMHGSDADYYTFSLSAPGTVSLDFSREYEEGSKAQWLVGVYDGDFEKLVEYTFYENDTQSGTSLIGLPAGTFYIKVSPGYYHSDATYKLTTKYTFLDTWETESNGSFQTADSIRLNDSVQGSSMHGSDTDYYAFSMSAPGAVGISFAYDYKEGSRAQWLVEVYNGKYEKLAGYTYYQNTTQSSAASLGLPAGTFYIKVSPGYYCSSATYKLTLENFVFVNKISLSRDSLSMVKGDQVSLAADVLPENASNPSVTWSSSNTRVATVSSNGTVKAVAEGTATITATASDGSGVKAACAVTVVKKPYGDYTGLKQDAFGRWLCVQDGQVMTDHTGLWNDPSVGWWYVENGVVNFDYTGLVCDPVYGWWLINGGAVDFGYTGLYYDADYGWWLIGGGSVAFGYSGLWGDPVYGWWLINGGTVDFGYTGLYCDANCGWWLIGGGSVAFDYNGLWGDPNYGWWLINGGTVAFGYNGLIPYGDGWWCVAGGNIAFNYTGLWYDDTAGWWYVEQGMVAFGYTGTVEYGGSTFYVENGRVIF